MVRISTVHHNKTQHRVHFFHLKPIFLSRTIAFHFLPKVMLVYTLWNVIKGENYWENAVQHFRWFYFPSYPLKVQLVVGYSLKAWTPYHLVFGKSLTNFRQPKPPLNIPSLFAKVTQLHKSYFSFDKIDLTKINIASLYIPLADLEGTS